MDVAAQLGELVAILAIGVVVAVVLGRVRVAAIAGLILSGVVVGPGGLGLVSDPGHVHTLADLGVAVLLFGIGLELTPRKIRKLRREVFGAGTLQVLVTTACAAGVGSLFGLPTRQAIFVGCIVALSSTAVVLSRLEQRQELGHPHGRLALGVLVMQDIAVVPMALLIPILDGAGLSGGEAALRIGLKTAFVVGTVFLGRKVVPHLLDAVARSRQPQLFVVTTVILCLGTAWLAALAGVSLVVGAFLAGVVVAGTEFRHQSLAQVAPLRDILTSFFFVSIGMLLDLDIIGDVPLTVAGLTAAIVVGKTIVTFGVVYALRWPLRTALAAALTIAQAGEFSFVLAHAARGRGLVPESLEQPLLAAIAVSLLLTPSLVDAAHRIAGWAGSTPLGRRLDRRVSTEVESPGPAAARHVIVAGFGPAGRLVVGELLRLGTSVCVVDLNPENVREASATGVRAIFGDASDAVVLQRADVESAVAVIIVVSDVPSTERAVRTIRSLAPDTHIVVRSVYSRTAKRLAEAGADQVIDLEAAGALELARRAASLAREEASQDGEIAPSPSTPSKTGAGKNSV